MKTLIKITHTALLTGSIVFFASCGRKTTSPITGWKYNDAANGGFEVLPYVEQETGPGLVLVEGGTFTMGRVEQDINYDWNTVPKRVTISSFYIDETEIRNLDYLEYLHWLSRIYGSDETFALIYVRALPDTLVWRSRLAFNDPYVEYYLRHPSYRDYPVVGINWLQASDFCVWRTDRVNEYILIREGILDWDLGQSLANNFNTDAYFAGKYEGMVKQLIPRPDGTDRKVRMEDGILLPKYHLPTEAEWEFAAYGLIGNTTEGRILERRLYPWNGHAVRNPNDKFIGDFMGNFVITGGDYMGIAGKLNDAADITAPVYSYWPNDYGLYNMAGNVSEWVMDVYRPLTYMDMDDFRPFRGNVFKTAMKDEDGIMVDQGDSLLYDDPDTSNYNRNLISRPGLVKLRNVDIKEKEDHLDERRNYKYADNINYHDGDHMSSVFYNGEAPTDEKEKNFEMYQFPVAKEKVSNPREVYQMSLINDKAHVYKGGSWKDRAYWMVPGTRRFLDQRQAAPWLGFRCAMTRVGSPKGMGGK